MWPIIVWLGITLLPVCLVLEVEERHPYTYQYRVYDENTESSYEVVQYLLLFIAIHSIYVSRCLNQVILIQ